MTGGERGFLLLTSHLGNPARKPLSVAQLRTLARRVAMLERSAVSREITPEDLIDIGYDRLTALDIVSLLQEQEALEWYLQKGRSLGCFPVTRASSAYPGQVRQRLGLDAPGCLWGKGNVELLKTQMICIVGSRELAEPNCRFAETVGREAAHQGITLVSGNARGADQTAQEACLMAGGSVISVVADALAKQPQRENVLYLSEDSFDMPFSAQRALSRNRVIHTLGFITLVAQCSLGMGGTWDGTVKNLQNGWSPVFCFDDATSSSRELEQLGAKGITLGELADLSALHPDTLNFL